MWRRNIFFGEKDANIQKIFKDYFCIKSTLIKYQIDTFDTFVVTALAENITMIVTSWVPTDILTNPYWLDHYAGSHSTPLQPIMKYQEADHWKKIKKFIWAKYFFHFSLSLLTSRAHLCTTAASDVIGKGSKQNISEELKTIKTFPGIFSLLFFSPDWCLTVSFEAWILA